ncbi:MAG TPA: response regulator [Candidatus Nanoarchaeia archaeon]|nr:response regulator [Candidatus Nanoarchaeia archaeon]
MTNERRTILIADDDENSLSSLELSFPMYFPDFTLELFENGNDLEARIISGMEDVFLVFTDNQMPGINGSDVIERYAKQYPEVSFVLHYGGKEEIGRRAIENGAKGYIIKPGSLNNLRTILGL